MVELYWKLLGQVSERERGSTNCRPRSVPCTGPYYVHIPINIVSLIRCMKGVAGRYQRASVARANTYTRSDIVHAYIVRPMFCCCCGPFFYASDVDFAPPPPLFYRPSPTYFAHIYILHDRISPTHKISLRGAKASEGVNRPVADGV